ncbi:hypothetical protein PSTEL_03990 [Paenibacillus stellifer]|uniref:Zinc chelation protein SecC n=1 Tax=Paenibacillus stellifer TaxID=169760 RepID=A0A089LNH1_9BACL|nr:SEC-C metal-binding domain-containing protein [Paenibacillus stellifer]AIQ62387.1 hypothetical protein PSTEL_03990 [Paenibacillus stellifer]
MSKIGRNEPCPCGSGKKYKKCCMEADKAAWSANQDVVVLPAEPVAVGTVAPLESGPVAIAEAKAPAKELKLTLPKLRKMVSRELEWEHPSHQQLGLTLIEQMKAEYDKELIAEGLMLWNGYSRMVKPVVKKEGAFCAAIEYLLSEEYGFMITQGDLALKYEVTAATVARRFKELTAYMEEYEIGETNEMLPSEIVIASLKGDASEKAEELLDRAVLAGSPKSRVQFARAVLELDPDRMEAYAILAEEAQDESEARDLIRSGIEAGRRKLGEDLFQEAKGLFWVIPEARPYVRLCHSYAESCWFGGKTKEAAAMLEHILEIDSDDHTGSRYLLPAVYLYDNRLDEAEERLEHFAEDDQAAAYAYDRMVLEFKRHGATARLKMLYRVAQGVNKHVPDYLLGARMLPHSLPDYIGVGDANEAVWYVILHSRLWTSVPELLKWMLKQ